MSAQYRPYRDEEDVPPEERAWVDDGPGGRIQIYEKTTQDIHHVVTQRHLILGGCSLAVVFCLIGLLIGYFAHTEHSTCVRGKSVALFSVYDEDPVVKSKILDYVSKNNFAYFVKLFSEGNGLNEENRIDITKSEWRKAQLDEIFVQNLERPVCVQGQKPNTLDILDEAGNVHKEYNLEISKDEFAYVAFSSNKTVQGKLVYAGRLGRVDLNDLSAKNISTNGSILLARYNAVPLRTQIENAFLLDAHGLILYLDPYDFNSKEYNSTAIPRVAAPTINEGEYALEAEEDFIHVFEKGTCCHGDLAIQTVSGDTARSLLELMQKDGPKAPLRAKGGFANIEYHTGPSKFDVKLSIHNQIKTESMTNLFGVIRGKVEPDRYVLVGAGRDEWSPSSVGGMAVLQELARVYGRLLLGGWRPRRTIVFCSFAAEHLNSAGLNHFVKHKLNLLKGRAVAYLDVTNPVFGYRSLLATSSPILNQALFNATMQVTSANTNSETGGKGIYKEWLETFPFEKDIKAGDLLKRNSSHDGEEHGEDYLLTPTTLSPNISHGLFKNFLHSALLRKRPLLRALDYSDGFGPVLTLAGIPVSQVSYVNLEHVNNKRMNPKPAWFRTQFDTLNRVRKEMDPGYRHHLAVTKVVAEMVRDLADSLFLPFNLLEYAGTLQTYVQTVDMHCKAYSSQLHLNLDITPLQHAVDNFTRAAIDFHRRQDKLDLRDPMAIRMINDQLLVLERAFLRERGLLGETSTKHLISSPPKSPPKVAEVFPGVLDLMMISIEDGSADDSDLDHRLQIHMNQIIETLNVATDSIRDVHKF